MIIEPVRVGVVGCGAISGAYLQMARNFPMLRIAACADLDTLRAQQAAAQSGAAAMTVDQLLADPSIEVVLNLTVPKAHVPVALAALRAGKHVYCEKPLGVDRAEGRKLMELAAAKQLRVGCAPDTFMGAGLQTARQLIDDGAIGRPVAVAANMQGRGHESWHPNPEFYYEVGGGPMFDMGPYYLTALLNLLGPVKRIAGIATIAIPDRTVTKPPKTGKKIKVETPDHIVGLMEFENGAAGTITQSFAVIEGGFDAAHPILINGTEGAMYVPDPNHFDGKVKLRRKDSDLVEMQHTFVTGYGRAVGLADMATAIRTGRPHRASGEQAFCVLDLMQGFLDSSTGGQSYRPTAEYHRPSPMPAHLPFGELD